MNKVVAALTGIGIAMLMLTALVPLIVDPFMIFPFVTPKAYAFRLLATGALICGLLPAIYRGGRPDGIFWALAALLIVMLVADADADFPRLAFTSTTERMGGFEELAFVVAYYAALRLLLRHKQHWQLILWSILGVTALVDMFAFYQAWLFPGVRVQSTLGNPAYLGTYACLTTFIALYVAQNSARWPSYLAYGMAVASGEVVFLTQTRAAILALFAGLCVVVWQKYNKRWIVALVLGSVGLILLEPDILHRFTHLASNHEEGNIRLEIWRMGWTGFTIHPWLGWGNEGFKELYLTHVTPYLRAFTNQPFDRAHNLEVDWLISGGLLGFSAYAALIGIGMRAAWRAPNRERSVLIGLLVAYVVDGQFIFDTPTSYPLLIVALALSASVSRDVVDRSRRVVHDKTGNAGAAAHTLIVRPVSQIGEANRARRRGDRRAS